MRKPRKPNQNDAIEPENTSPVEETAVEPKLEKNKDAAKERNRASEPVPEKAAASPEPVKHELAVTADATGKSIAFMASENILKRHTLAGGAVSLIPLPAADVLGLTGIQANLIEEISQAYGYAPTPGWSLRLAGLFAVSAGFLGVGKIALSSLAKLMPGAGTLIGIGGMAAYSAATTYALGRSIMSHYEDGGHPDNLVSASLIESAKASISEGREFWQNHRPSLGGN